MLRVVTANVNGIRAAARRGGFEWMASQRPDILCLQEVRADDETVRKLLADAGFGDWELAHDPSAQPGRAGVAILSRLPQLRVSTEIGLDEADSSGRWIEAAVATDIGTITVISTYVHTGEAGTGRQAQKFRFLDAMTDRLQLLRSAETDTDHVLVCGDLNIARSQLDIKNWRGNRGKAGFLPEEQAYLERWFADGWHDLVRGTAGEVAGPYTWWSWRGQAFDNDSGWRIDYAIATDQLADRAVSWVGRADSYAQRWSDHAPVVTDFTIPGGVDE